MRHEDTKGRSDHEEKMERNRGWLGAASLRSAATKKWGFAFRSQMLSCFIQKGGESCEHFWNVTRRRFLGSFTVLTACFSGGACVRSVIRVAWRTSWEPVTFDTRSLASSRSD